MAETVSHSYVTAWWTTFCSINRACIGTNIEALEATRERLSNFAETLGLPFEFFHMDEKVGNLDPERLNVSGECTTGEGGECAGGGGRRECTGGGTVGVSELEVGVSKLEVLENILVPMVVE
ncbi:hypothetical protein IFM89_037212 [Coptis chinensis]|uniref:Uncharacterized protein n=1 Tax=Coptis chinensis TaxID=261450 RepID=A0A835I1Y7_9MAGN|nr:hypothetical protein IFM89_037212 [Coptis chinensis]